LDKSQYLVSIPRLNNYSYHNISFSTHPVKEWTLKIILIKKTVTMRLLSEGKYYFQSKVFERPGLHQVLLKLKSNNHLDSGTVLGSAF